MNCWEYLKCPPSKKQNCEVFIYGHGKECWMIPKEGGHTSVRQNCLKCPWYIKNYKEGKV